MQTETMKLADAVQALATGKDPALCREARRWICRHDMATQAVEMIVGVWRRPGWLDCMEETARDQAQAVLFEGPGWPQSVEEHEALMAEAQR